MPNILGENLSRCFDLYRNRKKTNQPFSEYFCEYFESTILDSKKFNILFNDFLKNDFSKINNDTSNEEIDIIVQSLQNKLVNENIINTDCNVYELLGYILLGNVIRD